MRGSFLRATGAVLLTLVLWVSLAQAEGEKGKGRFDPVKDTFAFSNETFFAYGNKHSDSGTTAKKTDLPYSRRCFVMSRAAMQFYQFAEFIPEMPRLGEAEYKKLIKELSRTPVSQKRKIPKIVFPGFANLHEFSESYPRLLQENMGNWWPTYFRFGNWRMGLPIPRSGQRKLAQGLVKTMQKNRLAAIYITRFKPLNHCLVLYDCRETKTGVDFLVYDPNFIGKISHLIFDNETSSFYYAKTWYYPGGRVNAIHVYHSRFL